MSDPPPTESRGAALARCYDLDLLDDPGDLVLYEALAGRTGGPILELAVGTGRIAVPLAAAGYAVTGVDIDRYMLDRARRSPADARGKGTGRPARPSRRNAPAPTFVEADLLTLDLEERFALVILALNSLLLLGDRHRQAQALAAMARHLRPDGLAVIDVWLPGAEDLALYDGRAILEWVRDDPETGRRTAKVGSATHDAATQTVTLTQIFNSWPADGGPTHRIDRVDRMRLVGADELVAMAEGAGLEVERLAGDYELSPFGPGAERAIVIARPGSRDGLV